MPSGNPPSRNRARPAWALALAATSWLGVLVWAPSGLGAPAPTVAGALARTTYGAGRLLCHQRPERSFVRAGSPLPVCARCTGLYAGAVIGLVTAGVRRPRRLEESRRYRMLFALSACPTALSMLLEWAGIWGVGNVGRAVAAVPLAAVAGWMLAVALLAAGRQESVRA